MREYQVPEDLELVEDKEPITNFDDLIEEDAGESKIDLKEYVGIVSSPEPTDSVELKREAYSRQ